MTSGKDLVVLITGTKNYVDWKVKLGENEWVFLAHLDLLWKVSAVATRRS